MECLRIVFDIGGALLGMLLHICLECVLFVIFNIRFFVGLGAVMIEGALVIRVSAGILRYPLPIL